MLRKWILRNHCEFSADYPSLLRKLKDPLELRAHEKIIQFPFSTPNVEEKTEEELARIAERRREQGRRLQEMAAKARADKVHLPPLYRRLHLLTDSIAHDSLRRKRQICST